MEQERARARACVCLISPFPHPRTLFSHTKGEERRDRTPPPPPPLSCDKSDADLMNDDEATVITPLSPFPFLLTPLLPSQWRKKKKKTKEVLFLDGGWSLFCPSDAAFMPLAKPGIHVPL